MHKTKKFVLRYWFLFPILALLITVTGCADPYGACVKAGADIATGIATAMQTVDATQQNGYITPKEELNVVGYLEYANKADEAFLSCASTAHTAKSVKGSYTACASAFSDSLNNPAELDMIHVVNPSAQATVTSIVNTIVNSAGAIVSGLGGA